MVEERIEGGLKRKTMTEENGCNEDVWVGDVQWGESQQEKRVLQGRYDECERPCS